MNNPDIPDIQFHKVYEGVYGNEGHGDVTLICRMYGIFSNGSMVTIDVNLKDPSGLQIWRPVECPERLLPDNNDEIVQVEQWARQEAECLLERLEKLSQQAREKRRRTPKNEKA